MAFIALNRVIAPAFYARSDAKTPTWAGLASFAVNILLAVSLVGPFRGSGIALALSVASALNTACLVIALARSGLEGMKAELASALRYFGKILAFSVLAAAATYFLRPYLVAAFAASDSRLVYAGAPLAAETLVFGAIGLGLLALSRDGIAAAVGGRFFGRGRASK
jgi:putative peptidoglycan lipid II flippase